MLCPSCGNDVGDDIRLCDECTAKLAEESKEEEAEEGSVEGEDGESLEGEGVDAVDGAAETESETEEVLEHAGYAGFWLRVVSTMIDAGVIIVLQTAFSIIILNPLLGGSLEHVMESAVGSNPTSGGDAMFAALLLPMLGFILAAIVASVSIGWLYYALLESSPLQATIGKVAVGIQVVREDGLKVSFLRATARYFAKILSAAVLGVGFIMAAFTQRKQALHDSIAGVLVVRTAPIPLSRSIGCAVLGVIVIFGARTLEDLSAKVPASGSQISVPPTSAGSGSQGMFIPVTQGSLEVDGVSTDIQASYALYNPIGSKLEIAFFREALTAAKRETIEGRKTLSGADIGADALFTLQLNREAGRCQPEAVVSYSVDINKLPDGVSQSGNFTYSEDSTGISELRCQLVDGAMMKSVFHGSGKKKTRDGETSFAWNVSASGRLVVTSVATALQYSWQQAEDQAALWDPAENTVRVGYYASKLEKEDLGLIRSERSLSAPAENKPIVTVSFDSRENPESLRPEQLIKYGVIFHRGVSDAIDFPGTENDVGFYYVPSIQSSERLSTLGGFLREGETISGSLKSNAEKNLAGVPVSFTWDLVFNARVIDGSVETPSEVDEQAVTNGSLVPQEIEVEGPHARAAAGEIGAEFETVLALYYPGEKDIAVGFYTEPLSAAERAQVRKNRFLWNYVNNKRPNLVLFLNLRRSAEQAAPDQVLSYTAYFYRDKVGSFYFPGVHDRRSFKRLAREIGPKELKMLSGNLSEGSELKLILEGEHSTNAARVLFTWDVHVTAPLMVVK